MLANKKNMRQQIAARVDPSVKKILDRIARKNSYVSPRTGKTNMGRTIDWLVKDWVKKSESQV